MEDYIMISIDTFEEFLRLAPVSEVQDLVNKKNILLTAELSEGEREAEKIKVLSELPKELKPKSDAWSREDAFGSYFLNWNLAQFEKQRKAKLGYEEAQRKYFDLKPFFEAKNTEGGEQAHEDSKSPTEKLDLQKAKQTKSEGVPSKEDRDNDSSSVSVSKMSNNSEKLVRNLPF